MIRALLLSLLLAATANADPYFNSSEPGCDPANRNPNYVLCDDFGDGDWARTCNDPANAANDGWLLCNDTGGRGAFLPSVSPITGGGFAATSAPQGGNGGNSQLGMHGFYPNNATYDDLYVRFYIQLSPGYVSNNNQKFISLIRSAYQGGIDFGGFFGRHIPSLYAAPQWECSNDNNRNPSNPSGNWCYLSQNQGANLTLQGGSWHYVEAHVKGNTYGTFNGTWEVWANNCGTSIGGCTGTPTLRSRYTNVGWKGPNQSCSPSSGRCPNGGSYFATANANIWGSMWFDIWGNPADSGTIKIAKLIVSRAPIGFTGSMPPPQPVCGDGIQNGTEVCDGTSGCPAPGLCTASCTVCQPPEPECPDCPECPTCPTCPTCPEPPPCPTCPPPAPTVIGAEPLCTLTYSDGKTLIGPCAEE